MQKCTWLLVLRVYSGLVVVCCFLGWLRRRLVVFCALLRCFVLSCALLCCLVLSCAIVRVISVVRAVVVAGDTAGRGGDSNSDGRNSQSSKDSARASGGREHRDAQCCLGARRPGLVARRPGVEFVRICENL